MKVLRWVVPLGVVTVAACGSAAADADELASRAAAIGVDPDVVYAVALDGFEPVSQSVGVSGDAGFSTAYVSAEGGVVMLTTDPRGATSTGCGVSGEQQECVAVHDGVAVTLTAPAGVVDEDALRAAVAGAHPPSSEELAALFASMPADGGDGGGPVERGDLPAEGDGAPLDPEGAAG
ncbi:hypothetical protein E1212_18925 [Jiangella ureilytica]|uniref:Membrane lipoprotein n=1 Tax=Jiangella ureilytica TaxID=2530374 RepID=A0A4R4RIE3_9ACTN|nr:hypothetical protein [Jiangella ureilytica]TDC49170.1 hypothetical protein E1212_18925 [Jiangella ureilytica]